MAAVFVSSIVFGAGCLDGDESTPTKDDQDLNDPNGGGGVGDPGDTGAPAGGEHGLYANQLDPQTSPDQTCHQRVKGGDHCE